ncbi:DUF2264 domain-containing protein [soil metagenome]
MRRRIFLRSVTLTGLAGAATPLISTVHEKNYPNNLSANNDRVYWSNLLYKISNPVVSNMARGTLKENMPKETGQGYSLKLEKVTYLEAFGRTVCGLAPWLALPNSNSSEDNNRRKLVQDVLQGYTNSVDPSSPDYLNFREEGQPLVDAAFYCHAFLRAPKALWEPLDNKTKQNIIKELRQLRKIQPPYSNWLLFAAIIEVFFLSVDEEWDPLRIQIAIRKMQEWYAGDGWYSDGPHFAFDYYNGYVIHPMLVDVLKVLTDKGKWKNEDYEQALKRMQRFAELQERMIAPDGSYPAIGRSLTYRVGAFQPLAQLALQHQLPTNLAPAQVRCALTAVMKKVYEMDGTFNDKGWLQPGVCGHQPELADTYTSTGSLYLCTNGFLPLGLPEDDPFWMDAPVKWTAQKLWSGEAVKKDYRVDY